MSHVTILFLNQNAELELSSDLTMLAWMLVASDEATAGSVIPKHDLFELNQLCVFECQ